MPAATLLDSAAHAPPAAVPVGRATTYLLFAVLVLMNVSKWYVEVGVRIGYYIPAAFLWIFIMLAYQGLRPLPRNSPIAKLVFLKVLFVVYLALHFGLFSLMSGIASPALFAKGLVIESINTGIVVVAMLYATRLTARKQSTILTLYLAAAVVAAGFSVAEAVAVYGFAIDLDQVVSSHLLFWSGPSPSALEDVFGLAAFSGHPIYRLSGLTGDPNVNGMILVTALPILIYKGAGRHPFLIAAIGAVFLAVILMTVSNTAIPLALLVIAALGLLLRGRAGWLPKTAVAALGAALVVAIFATGPALTELAGFKLSPDGTASQHLGIAGEAIGIWLRNPQGIGLNNFSVYSQSISTHNSYVRVLAELGPVGLGLTLSWITCCFLICIRLRTALGLSAAMCVAAWALGSFGHDLLFRFEFQFPIHLLIAIAVGQARSAPDPEPRANPTSTLRDEPDPDALTL